MFIIHKAVFPLAGVERGGRTLSQLELGLVNYANCDRIKKADY